LPTTISQRGLLMRFAGRDGLLRIGALAFVAAPQPEQPHNPGGCDWGADRNDHRIVGHRWPPTPECGVAATPKRHAPVSETRPHAPRCGLVWRGRVLPGDRKRSPGRPLRICTGRRIRSDGNESSKLIEPGK
jgi:hypothetical protein